MKDKLLRVIQFNSPSHPVTPTDNRGNSGLRKRLHLKYILTLISLVLVASIALSPGTRAAGITEYSLPPGSTKPYGIAVDDKSPSLVWTAIYGSDEIASLDGTNILEFQLPTGSRPWDIAYDNYTDSHTEYRVWFTESQRHRIGLIDKVKAPPPEYRLLEFYLVDGAGPRGIALQYGHVQNSSDPSANWVPRVWFTEFGIGAIGVLTWDNVKNESFVTQWYLPDSNCQPLDIIYLNTTGVWFTEYQGHRIGNFNPATGELREWPLPPGSYPWGIANDTYGNIWFTESGRNRIGKLNPYTNEITEYYIPTPGAQPYEIVVDRYNNVWFTEHGTNRIGRFSPGTNTLVEFERKSGGAPWGIAYAYAGAYKDEIWFTEEVGNRIGRIDDTVAKTTITVTSKYIIATQSTTATTLGSSVTLTSATTTNATYIFTADATTTNTTETTASYTSYRVTETSSFLKTSSVAESTSTVTYTATTTLTATSYVTTIYETTSITATTTKVETSLTSITATSTMTSYIATLTATGTVTSTSTVTMTSYQYATTGQWPMIPGYPPSSIILGLALGLAAMSAPVIFKGWRRRRSSWLAAMLALFLILVVAMAPATRAALVTEWKLPPGSTMPYGMAFDDQSPYRVWFAEFGSDKIGRLDHVSGEIFEIIIPSTSQPWGVAFEPANHEIWFTMSGRHRLGVVKGYGNSIFELVLPDGSQPRGIAIQEHVNGTDYPYIWIALYGSDQIARVDPYYAQKIVYWSLDPGAKPQSIIFVPDTGVWFTEDGPGKIGNLNPATGEVKEWDIPDNGKAWALASDSYGFIWFTDYANDRLGRLNPYTGEIILYGIPTSSSQPYGIAIDSKGDVWFAEHAQNRLGRFSPDSLTFEEFVRPTGGSVWDVAISEDGKIWFTDDAGNKICRLDPSQALATTTVSEISTASKTTTTEMPLSSTITTSSIATTVKSDVSTTRTTAPTTVTTTYGLTETVKVLKTSTTTSTTSYIPTTVTVLGDLTVTVTNTASTHTVTSTTPYTSTTYTYTTVTGTFTTTKYTTVTTTTTLITTITTAFGFGVIPGYSTASILIGLITGAASLAILNLRRLKRR